MFVNCVQKILKKQPKFRLKQAEKAIFVDLIDSWDNATIFSKDLREKLNKECPLKIKDKLLEEEDKNTAKALIFLEDDQKVETVLMKHKNRNTVCISSQVGCPMGCLFCATGNLGFERNLTCEEIILQVIFWARYLKKIGGRVDNIVFMGMGEPLLNYDEVRKAINILNDKEKFGIGSRKISISTCGIPEGIKKLMQEGKQVNLALSLHASNDRLRSEIMPINKKHNIDKVLGAVKDYIDNTGRKVMIEYVLLSGINDAQDNARELARFLKKELKHLFFVNLINYNETGRFRPSSLEQTRKFKNILENENIIVVERYRFGQNIKGACGQLAGVST